MRQENIDFLEANRHVHHEVVHVETATGARGIINDLLRIMREEFAPGYVYDGGCGNCIFNMVKLLYRYFDEWRAANPVPIIVPTEPQKVKANFPSHKNHRR